MSLYRLCIIAPLGHLKINALELLKMHAKAIVWEECSMAHNKPYRKSS